MKTQRSDLAMELHEYLLEKNQKTDGIICSEEILGNSKLTTTEIKTESASKIIGKPIGHYYTIEIGHVWLDDAEEYREKVLILKDLLVRILSPFTTNGCTLVAGLGNRDITADAIGPEVISHMIVTRHIQKARPDLFTAMGFSELAAITPGVLGDTGLESAEVITCLSKHLHPRFVIVVDALAARRIGRLASTIQISDNGISPGSGVGNNRPTINAKHLGVPVIAIGVPTVVDAATLALDAMESFKNKKGEPQDLPSYGELKKLLDDDALNLFVTPKETDRIIESVSTLIAYALNLALHPGMDYEEMLALLS